MPQYFLLSSGMCGRYTLILLHDLAEVFDFIEAPRDTAPRYNIAPSQDVLAARNVDCPAFEPIRWGLVPSWAKDTAVGNRMINARAETLASKPAFRESLRRRRCIIPADGFYEWRADPGSKSKRPMYIRMKSGKPFGFAGLWERWRDPGGEELLSCTIITTVPNELMTSIHARMPAILSPGDYREWLSPREMAAERAGSILGPYPSEQMEAWEVSRWVNRPGNDSSDWIAPMAQSPGLWEDG